MNYRRLGRSGVKVSEVYLGSWLTYGGSVAEERARACIHKAYGLGINFFDTANVYVRGAAEEIVGRALEVSSETPTSLPQRCTSRWGDQTTVASRASTSPNIATPR